MLSTPPLTATTAGAMSRNTCDERSLAGAHDERSFERSAWLRRRAAQRGATGGAFAVAATSSASALAVRRLGTLGDLDADRTAAVLDDDGPARQDRALLRRIRRPSVVVSSNTAATTGSRRAGSAMMRTDWTQRPFLPIP